MEISKRLQKICEMVQYTTVADVGTDHGYVPIWLCEQGRLTKGIACDIHKSPLNRAAENIAAAGFSSIIKTRFGDGLTHVEIGEVESAVISGMGGMLTIDILQNSPRVVKSLKELVLSPQLDLPKVRRYLHSIGFLIAEEHMIYEDKKYYTVLRAVPGSEKYGTDTEYIYGRCLLKQRDAVFCEYLKKEIVRLEALGQRLQRSESKQAKERLTGIIKEQKVLLEVEKWL